MKKAILLLVVLVLLASLSSEAFAQSQNHSVDGVTDGQDLRSNNLCGVDIGYFTGHPGWGDEVFTFLDLLTYIPNDCILPMYVGDNPWEEGDDYYLKSITLYVYKRTFYPLSGLYGISYFDTHTYTGAYLGWSPRDWALNVTGQFQQGYHWYKFDMVVKYCLTSTAYSPCDSIVTHNDSTGWIEGTDVSEPVFDGPGDISD